MKVFTIQFTEDELTELENVLDQHVYAEVIDEIQDYMKSDFKNPLREPFEETN